VVLCVGLCEFLAATAADCLGKVALEVAEEWKWRSCAPFLTHEQQRRRRRQQHDRERGFERASRREHCQPLAKGAVADLVVVLQEIDKGRCRERQGRLATCLALGMLRRPPLIGASFSYRPDNSTGTFLS